MSERQSQGTPEPRREPSEPDIGGGYIPRPPSPLPSKNPPPSPTPPNKK